jgi:5-oxoprolinase (ATP-hydrolysing) subunit A
MEIDLNADLGERAGSEELAADLELLALVSSANVACGFHAGDPTVMRETCAAAVEAGVCIGAHPGYWDREGMGRRELSTEPAQIEDEAVYQLGALIACAASVGGRVTYVKPHGALYTRCARDPECAAAVVGAAKSLDLGLAILAPHDSALFEVARAEGLAAFAEGFVDRGYLPSGEIVPRSEPASLLEPTAAIRQVREIAAQGTVRSVDGEVVPLPARSLCIHSDTPGALGLAQAVRRAFESDGIRVKAFT